MHILTAVMSTSNGTDLESVSERAVMLAKRKKVLVENKELLVKRETEFKKKLWLCDDTYWETMDKLFTTEDEILKINRDGCNMHHKLKENKLFYIILVYNIKWIVH